MADEEDRMPDDDEGEFEIRLDPWILLRVVPTLEYLEDSSLSQNLEFKQIQYIISVAYTPLMQGGRWIRRPRFRSWFCHIGAMHL